GNAQDIRFVEIVFDQIMLVFGLGVQVEARLETGFVRINDGLPCAIQADGRTVGKVVNGRGRIGGGVSERRKSQQQEQTSHRSLAGRAILLRVCDGVKRQIHDNRSQAIPLLRSRFPPHWLLAETLRLLPGVWDLYKSRSPTRTPQSWSAWA